MDRSPIKRVLTWDKTVEVVDYNSMCQITESIDQAIDWISEAMDWEYVHLI